MTLKFFLELQLRDFLQSNRLAFAGISHMTPDLLGEIFGRLCVNGPLPLRHLLFVSRGFHHAAVNNAHLWTTISLDSLFARHFNERPEQGNRFVEQCLVHSGSLPLRLYIDYSDPEISDPLVCLGALQTFGNPMRSGFERCTSLIWRHNQFLSPGTTEKIVD